MQDVLEPEMDPVTTSTHAYTHKHKSAEFHVTVDYINITLHHKIYGSKKASKGKIRLSDFRPEFLGYFKLVVVIKCFLSNFSQVQRRNHNNTAHAQNMSSFIYV